MNTDEIAKEITLKMLDDEGLSLTTDTQANENFANEVVKFFKIIYKGVEEAKNTSAENITIGTRR